jgi:hypothetical protein
MLQAPGIKLLKLKYDKPLPNFALRCNLRHYTTVYVGAVMLSPSEPAHAVWKVALSGVLTGAGFGGAAGVAGAVEEVRVWGRALSGCEVEGLLRADAAALDFSAAASVPAGTPVPAAAAAAAVPADMTKTTSVMLPAGFLQAPFSIASWVFLREDGAGAGDSTVVLEARGDSTGPGGQHGQGLTLVHVRAQFEQLQDTFMSEVGLHGGRKSSS